MPEDRVDFFISRTGADSAWAQWIAQELEEAGYITVLQDWDFAGKNFVLAMEEAMVKSDHTIVVLSDAFLSGQFTQTEWATVVRKDPTGQGRALMVVRVDECDTKGSLGNYDRIDVFGIGEAKARERLLTMARVFTKGGRTKPAGRIPFPDEQTQPPPSRLRFPGALPPTRNKLPRRNRNFTGRQALLDELRSSLMGGDVVALHGLGGSGKSSVAIEYLYRHHVDYDIVWWIRAGTDLEETDGAANGAGRDTDGSVSAVVTDLAALARGLDLAALDDPDLPAADAMGRWLEGHDRWLLVFDNAPSPAEIGDHLPRGGGGHVIITSRYPAWGAVARTLPVEVFEPEQAVAFLLRRTGRNEPEAAADIGATLGYLPLALEQAGAYVEERSSSLAAYAQSAGRRLSELLALGQPSGYPATVGTTWDLSFGVVEETSPSAAAVLRLCAFLAPEAIPLDRLLQAPTVPAPLADLAGDALALDDAIATLRRYSLVERSGGDVSMHRLVQAVTRDRLDDEQWVAWAAAAVSLVAQAFVFDVNDTTTWDPAGLLFQHALMSASHAESVGTATEAVSGLMNTAGQYLYVQARFTDARAAFQRALRIDEAAHGPEHPNVARDLIGLGVVLRNLGDLAGARAAYERGLRIHEAAHGPEHPVVAGDVNNLGSVLADLGDLAGARAAFERALRIDEAAHGPEYPNVARDVNNLGRVLQDLGDLVGARASFERALRIDEAAYGPEHPNVATDVNNLGNVLRDLGDLTGARAAYERALRIHEAAHGAEHPNTATARRNLEALDDKDAEATN